MALSHRFLISFCLLFLLISPLAAFAASLAQYREKVQNAKNLADQINYLDQEELSPADYSRYERELLMRLRQSLPPSERVEWKGTSIETNNQWLHDKLNDFEKESTNSPNRTTILTEISERLAAIEQKINELESPVVSDQTNGKESSNLTKDENKQKLDEILRREEYKKAEPEESFFERIMKRIREWLGRNTPQPNIPQTPSTGFQSFSLILQILIYGLIAAAIGYLIYRFAPYFIQRFREREKREKKERIILGEKIAANELPENLFSEAERLAREGNLRGAIRKGYIALLCELSDRKIIGLSQHKTNRDYLRDVRKRRELYEKLNGLTANYERHWYGFETADEKDWEEFKNDYKQAITANR